MTYEEVNFGIRRISTKVAWCTVNIHPRRLWTYHTNVIAEKSQMKMEICPWALVSSFHIVCIWS